MNQPIWRCRACGYKTHHRYWKDEKQCPVCGLCRGSIPGNHGGLDSKEIQEKKKEMKKRLENMEELDETEEYQLEWLLGKHIR